MHYGKLRGPEKSFSTGVSSPRRTGRRGERGEGFSSREFECGLGERREVKKEVAFDVDREKKILPAEKGEGARQGWRPRRGGFLLRLSSARHLPSTRPEKESLPSHKHKTRVRKNKEKKGSPAMRGTIAPGHLNLRGGADSSRSLWT